MHSVAFSILADPDNKFSISENHLLVNGTLDYESSPSHSVTIRATDTVNNESYDETLTVSVSDTVLASSFIATSTSSTDASTYTFSGHDIGVASSDRYVLVAVHGRTASNFTFESLTIGGVSATLVGQAITNGSAVGFFVAPIPSGTTADIVLINSATLSRVSIAVYSLTGLGSTAAADTGSDTTSANPLTTTIDVPAEGAAFAAVYNGSGASPSSSTWAGLSERYDFQIESNHDNTGASTDFAAAQTGLAVSAQNTGLVSNGVLYVISLR